MDSTTLEQFQDLSDKDTGGESQPLPNNTKKGVVSPMKQGLHQHGNSIKSQKDIEVENMEVELDSAMDTHEELKNEKVSNVDVEIPEELKNEEIPKVDTELPEYSRKEGMKEVETETPDELKLVSADGNASISTTTRQLWSNDDDEDENDEMKDTEKEVIQKCGSN